MPLARQDDDGDEPLIPLAWRLTVPACNFFNVHDGQDLADSEGTELADRDEAHRQAFIMAGEMLKSADKTFLQDDVWEMRVTDDAGKTVCRLKFSAEDCD